MRRSSVWEAVIAYPQDEQNLAFAGIWVAQDGHNMDT
jgi:hypothetical protein